MDIEKAARFIAKFEGFVDHVYRDAIDVETIGYGETDRGIIEQYRHGGISEPEAFELLVRRVADFAEGVDQLVEVPLNDDQHAALTSFAYNLGLGALAESTLRQKLNVGNYEAVPSELAKWVYAGGRRLEGLVRRREAEADLFSGGAGGSGSGEVLCQRGDSGPEVELAQRLLVEKHGYAIIIDGQFGPATDEAVRSFQEKCGLTVDGVVGPATWRALNELPPPITPPPTHEVLVKKGDVGPQVAEVQRLLSEVQGFSLAVDGHFGDETAAAVLEFQARNGLDQDAVVGPATWRALHEAAPREVDTTPTEFWARRGQQGDSVAAVQRLLSERHRYRVAVDGDFGPATHRAVVDFQGRHGLEPDGIVGPATWRELNEGAVLDPPPEADALGWEAIDAFLARRGISINAPPEGWQTTEGNHSPTSFHYPRFDPECGFDIGHARDYSYGMGCDEHAIVEALLPHAGPGGPIIELYHAPTGTWLYDGHYWNVGGHADHAHASIRPGSRMPA